MIILLLQHIPFVSGAVPFHLLFYSHFLKAFSKQFEHEWSTFHLSILCPQHPLSSLWCAPTTRSSTLSSFIPSQSSASFSSLCCWCDSRAATTARAKKARMVPPCCGLKNHTSVILPPVWTPLLSACTQALLTKRGSLPSCLANVADPANTMLGSSFGLHLQTLLSFTAVLK